MLNLSNLLTFLRAPLALVFLSHNVCARLFALLLAMATDYMDGYIARKTKTTSQFGAKLDPLMDKFFVFFVLSILFIEGKIELWQALAMISRDFFLCLFALYLSFCHLWGVYKYGSIRWGKISTTLQFLILISLTLGYTHPSIIYTIFILTGSLAFVQLLQRKPS